MNRPKRVNCYQCQFFYVTWDPHRPNGCRALGFKTKILPSMTVLRASGKPCNYFKKKIQTVEKK